MIVYAVNRSSGMWDDYMCWVHAIFSNKEKAEKFIYKKNEQLGRLKEYSSEITQQEENEEEDLPAVLSRHFEILDQGEFYLTEFEVID